MSRQLERDLGIHTEEGFYTPECSQRLKKLTQRLLGQGETSGWAKCISGHTVDPVLLHESTLLDQGTQKKRKISLVTQDSDGEENGQQSKRIKVDKHREDIAAPGRSGQEATFGGSEGVLFSGAPLENQEATTDSPCHDLPEHMKVRAQFAHHVVLHMIRLCMCIELSSIVFMS